MKKILFLFIILSLVVNSQTYEPTKVKLRISSDTLLSPIFIEDSLKTITNKYNLGWHWSGETVMTKHFKMNQIHQPIQQYRDDNTNNYNVTADNYFPGYYVDSTNLVMRSSFIGGNWPGWSPIYARALHYDPTIKANEMKDHQFKGNGLIGFKHNAGIVLNNRLVARTTDFSSDTLLLAQPLISNVLTNISEQYPSNQSQNTLKQVKITSNKDINGEELYFSINLRRLNDTDLINNESTLLRLKIKLRNIRYNDSLFYPLSMTTDTSIINNDSIYIRKNIWDSLIPIGYFIKRNYYIDRYAKFYEHPRFNQNDTVNLPYNRGLVRKNLIQYNDTIINITRNMLPKGNENERDITISVKMIFNKNDNNNTNNFYLKGVNDTISPIWKTIDSILPEIYYIPNGDVAINWVRIETKAAQDFVRGYWDSLLIWKMQTDIDSITKPSSIFARKGIKPYRWYLMDEYHIEYWPTNRYLYKLFGPVFTTETGAEYPQLYESYFGTKERWFSEFSYTTEVAAPYIRYGHGGWDYKKEGENYFYKFLNLKGGFRFRLVDELSSTPKFLDTLNSAYEMWADYSLQQFKNVPIDDYLSHLRGSHLCHHEKGTYDLYYNPENMKYLYYGCRWYGQFFELVDWQRTIVNWKKNPDTIAVHVHYRPKTGEEIRLWSNNLMIMSAKGILTDGEVTTNIQSLFENSTSNGRTATKLGFLQKDYDTIPNLSNNPLEFILDKRVGTDFIVPNDPSQLYKYINFDTCSVNFQIDKSRIYIGQRSNRLEIYKEFSKIRFTENELLKLKLVSWYGKGFKVLTNQDTNFQQNIFGNIINFDQNKLFTKRIWNPATQNIQFQKEAWDSSFFDLTLLRDSTDNQLNLSKPIYLGIQNRRTDPLIFEKNFPNNQNNLDSSMQFYTTAEFDEFCTNDSSNNLYGVKMPKSYWKSQFWKRLACRELHLPFNYPLNPIVPTFKYYNIKELGVGTKYFNQDSGFYWTDSKYYHKIDTNISLKGTLISRLLPGQGKIVKVELKNIFEPIGPSLTCEDLAPNMHFNVIKNTFRWDSCYYDLYLRVDQGWQYDSTDIKVKIRSDRTPSYLTFNSNYNYSFFPIDSTSFIRLDSIPVDQDILIGSFRIDCDEHFTVNYQFGRRIMEIYPYCEDDESFESDCICGYQMRSSTNCCDNIELYSAETTENGQLSGKFNINIKQNSTDCAICEVSLVRKNDTKVLAKLSKEKNEKKLQIPNFTNIGKITMDKSNGRTKDTINAYIKDKDGKLICKKEVILETFDWKQEKSIELDEEPTESNTTDLTLQYFPNPVEELLNIEIKSDICKKVKVRITNLESFEIFSKELKTNNLTQISTEKIPNGVYFLKIEDCESDKFIIKKIVIRK